MQQVKAVVALAKGEPVEVVTINVPDPGPGSGTLMVTSSTGSPWARAMTALTCCMDFLTDDGRVR